MQPAESGHNRQFAALALALLERWDRWPQEVQNANFPAALLRNRISRAANPGQDGLQTNEDQARGADMNVLLVDQSVAIQQSFGALLQAAPEVVVVGYADDVASALASIASNPPDLIVLDSKLRGDDRGIDVLRYVRRHHPDIKVVVLSHFAWASVRKIHIDAGALAYFDKAIEFQLARDYIADLANAQSAAPSGRGSCESRSS
ncbi:response regulator [Variovorax sp. GT1P44]|uniref:response regulator n=1 Tax=Variovorax sp. GT1P44 TaxID=3443742 RepID=UPI003F451871